MSDILYSTDLGKYYLGKCEETIQELNLKEKEQLILTSPPFPLNIRAILSLLIGGKERDHFRSFHARSLSF